MEIIGVDLHKRESQLSIKADDGSITDRRIATSRERFTAVLGARRTDYFNTEIASRGRSTLAWNSNTPPATVSVGGARPNSVYRACNSGSVRRT